jgi:hypothetical protein
MRLAPYAAVAAGNLHAYQSARDTADDLRIALGSRAVIDQAEGILTEGHELTADQAFQVLARVSMQSNRKLRHVADHLVTTGELIRPWAPPPPSGRSDPPGAALPTPTPARSLTERDATGGFRDSPSRGERCPAACGYRPGMPLVLHWGGPRHGDVDDVRPELLTSSVLVYDGPRWFGVYERFQPVQVRDTPSGPAEVWVVRE